MKYLLGLFSIAICLTSLSHALERKPMKGKQAEQLLKQVEKNFSKIKTIKTRLTQEKDMAFFSEKVVSKGFCVFKAPDKLRLEYVTPFKSSLIVDSNQVFKYEFYNNHWQKLNIGNKEIMLIIMKNITAWMKEKKHEGRLLFSATLRLHFWLP